MQTISTPRNIDFTTTTKHIKGKSLKVDQHLIKLIFGVSDKQKIV